MTHQELRKLSFEQLAEFEEGTILAEGMRDGYAWMVVRNLSLCGYVGVPEDHPLYGLDYNTLQIRVHGGLTFSGKANLDKIPDKVKDYWFFGWDYGHHGDVPFYVLNEDISDNLKGVYSGNKRWLFSSVYSHVMNTLLYIKRITPASYGEVRTK